MDHRRAAEAIFREGVKAVHPQKLMRSALGISGNILKICGSDHSLDTPGRIYVAGAGKANAAMALALEELLGEHITGGLIAVKYGHDLPLKKIKQLAAAHPVPDENSLKAAAGIREVLEKAAENDLVICLFSGGASSLMADCPEGIRLDDLQQVSDLLLRSGAGIAEINTVRKHLSNLKGGQLARRAYPANLVSLIISDVVGDDPGVIASGPTVADPGTYGEAMDVLKKYKLGHKASPAILQHLQKGCRGEIPETPKPGDPLFSHVRNHIIGSNKLALEAASKAAETQGYKPHILDSQAAAPADDLALRLIGEASRYRGTRPACLLMGGESTLEVQPGGKGGRSQHLTLRALLALEGNNNITVLSAGTDGTDGPTDMAGAVADIDTLENARRLNLQPEKFLREFDSYHFFEKAGGHIHTGPTQTNVMDIMMALVY